MIGLARVLCGEREPVGSYVSTGDSLTLRFKSDFSGTDDGFKLLITPFHTGKCRSISICRVTCRVIFFFLIYMLLNCWINDIHVPVPVCNFWLIDTMVTYNVLKQNGQSWLNTEYILSVGILHLPTNFSSIS